MFYFIFTPIPSIPPLNSNVWRLNYENGNLKKKKKLEVNNLKIKTKTNKKNTGK